ncbi:MAG: HD domain-containing protein [Actinomycetota bacterium]|nr:HD domain-containing protein [Actinomycetota bacterium]
MTSTLPVEQSPGRDPSVLDLLSQARDVEADDLGRARSLVQQARVLARSQRDAPGEAEALYRLAELSYASGLNNEAFAVALEARDLAQQCGAALSQVSALNLIAAVQYHAANFSEALSAALAALELYRSTDERVAEGMLLNSLAVIQHSLRDTDRAIVTYEAALMANKGQNRPDLDAITLANMAKVRADRHEDLLAVSLGESALELAKAHAPEFVPEILARLAIAYVALSALDRAVSCLDEADGVLRDRTTRRVALSPGSVVTVRVARGELYVAQHLRDHALREWGDALDLATQANMTEVALTLREKLAGLCKEMGRFEHALAHQEARYALNEEMFNRGTDLRIKTLQIQHDTEAARHQSEILRLRTTDLEQLVSLRTDEVEAFQIEVLLRIAVMAEFRNTDTAEHPIRVGDLSAEIAQELGEPTEYVNQLRLAARLHDIGKVAVPDAILMKPGPLTAAEFDLMKTHTTLGAEILSGSSSPTIQLAAELALTHHERWDGSGYPGGVAGAVIPLSGRIVTIADVYDALISARVYKHAWSSIDAINYIVAGRGAQFEPRMVAAFIAVMARRDPALAALIDRSKPA